MAVADVESPKSPVLITTFPSCIVIYPGWLAGGGGITSFDLLFQLPNASL